MRRFGVMGLLAGLVALGASVPALAGTIVVGYLPPGVDFGAEEDGGVPLGQVRARGVVVDNLEPGARELDTRNECAPGGCPYELIVVDSAARRAVVDAGAAGCGGLAYGVIDPEPEETRLGGGARLYAGEGSLPERTESGGVEEEPAPLTPGIGTLCFATPTHADGLTNDAGDGPLAATQPHPVVILYDAPDD